MNSPQPSCYVSAFYWQADWPQPMPAIGRLANFSSLRKHRPKEYSIYDAYFGKKKIIFICFIILTMIRIMQICTLIIIGQFGLMNHFVWFLERQKGKSFWFWLRYFSVEYMCSFNLHSVILKPQAFGNISEIVLLLEFEMRIERQFLFKYALFPYRS